MMKISCERCNRNLPFILILIGIILRISQFIYNRSLTEGEAALAMNILQRSYAELLKPLDYVQAAPVGFLLIQKFFSNILGNNDFSMRCFPLICGIISILLFYQFARRLLNQAGLIWGLLLFSTCDWLIYFSSEVKQYSSDVAIAILLIIPFLDLLKDKEEPRKFIITGIVAAISLWFSHSSLFIFLGGVIVLSIIYIKEKDLTKLYSISLMTAIWFISFIVNYNLSLKGLSQNQPLLEFWQKSFMPLPPKSFADLKWVGFVFLKLFRSPLGLSIYELFLPVFSFLVGLVILWKKNQTILGILMLPIILTLFASGLRKYPFEGRLLLFTVPLMIPVIATGIEFIRERMSQGSKILGNCLVILIFIHPVILALYHLIIPRAPEELRPVIEYVKKNSKQGDVVYLYYASYNAFKYYSARYGFNEQDYIVGIESRFNWGKYYEDLSKLKGYPRVWILFSHVIKTHGVDEEKLFLMFLDKLGKKLDQFNASGASCYLYNLADPP